jgi:chorismate mutase
VSRLKSRGVTHAGGAIDEQRRRIDVIDASILDLLNERAHHVSAVFDIKQAANVPRFDADRTRRIIERLKGINQGPLTDGQVEAIFGFLLRHFAFEHDRPDTAAASECAREPAAHAPAVRTAGA